MKQETIFNDNQTTTKKRSGPPNKMNDLSYKEWMKFQKSFFRHTSFQHLTEEFIYFFTKSKWDSGLFSRSLIIGVEGFDNQLIPSPRITETKDAFSFDDVLDVLNDALEGSKQYDFLMIDFRQLIKNKKASDEFVLRYSENIFKAIRQLLRPKMYCCILAGFGKDKNQDFPYPWALALSSRNHVKLRDEKIGLIEYSGELYYTLIFQAEDDERRPFFMISEKIINGTVDKDIPTWIFPKSPARKPNEILHPAKFPETLVREFIELFTEPGDKVFDPMVGTGSTVLAAVQSGRKGYGIDISLDFINIAKSRMCSTWQISLFEETSETDYILLQGDATKVEEIEEFKNLRFQYVITSPPYWSMLSNKGSENQKTRRQKKLPLVYSDDKRDLGNVQSYDEFLYALDGVYKQVAKKLVEGGYLTIVVKNIKRDNVVYPLAWDLVSVLCKPEANYEYIGTTMWCQDDIGLKPFAVGIHWVSNTLHHYCLHFRKK